MSRSARTHRLIVAVVVSLLAHVLLLRSLTRQGPTRPERAGRPPVELTIHVPPPPPAESTPPKPSTRPKRLLRSAAREAPPTAAPPATTTTLEADAATLPAGGDIESASPRRMDLFAPGAIATGAGRDAPPASPPLPSPDRGALDIAGAAHDLTSPDLSPDTPAARLQRALAQAFVPERDRVRSDPERFAEDYLFVLPQIPALTRALATGCWNGAGCPDAPADISLLTVVLIEHDESGIPISWRVVQSSGSGSFDADAIAAVRHVVKDEPPMETSDSLLRSRWVFSAEVVASSKPTTRARRVRLVAMEYRKRT